jgi:3-deoxy-7-phosphoheptulonate synthase
MNGIRLAARREEKRTQFTVGEVTVGKDLLLIAGPCSVESEEQMWETARAARAAGANMLRGGAFKPRSSPYSFQGMGLAGVKILRRVGDEFGLPVVTEVMDTRDVAWLGEFADVLQVGARNMQNFALLKEVGRSRRPVILKRGMNATLEEWLSSAEYILSEGNDRVILCERGIRTFERYTRNTMDLSAVPAVHELAHLPVIVDPSHGTGKVSLIPAMCLAAVAGGADGIMVEVHARPAEALCDADQALTPEQFAAIAAQVKTLAVFIRSTGADDRPAGDLAECRRRINQLDAWIMSLLRSRMELALQTRRFKTGVLDRGREEEVLGNVMQAVAGPLSEEFCRELYGRIMAESRRLQDSEETMRPALDPNGEPVLPTMERNGR